VVGVGSVLGWSKNKQRQPQISFGDDKQKYNGKKQKQIPCGDDNQRCKNKGNGN